nr:hypothetical protein Itr_chr15CG04550 [Ipomoea trifida]
MTASSTASTPNPSASSPSPQLKPAKSSMATSIIKLMLKSGYLPTLMLKSVIRVSPRYSQSFTVLTHPPETFTVLPPSGYESSAAALPADERDGAVDVGVELKL